MQSFFSSNCISHTTPKYLVAWVKNLCFPLTTPCLSYLSAILPHLCMLSVCPDFPRYLSHSTSIILLIPVQISSAHHFYRHEPQWHLQGAGQRDLDKETWESIHQKWRATSKVCIQYSRRRRLHASFNVTSRKTPLSTSPQFLIIPFTVIFSPVK